MRRTPPASLNSRVILPQTIASILGPEDQLPYNWLKKVRRTILGIALARSLQLQDIVRTQHGLVKTLESVLSRFLNRDRLDLDPIHRRYVVAALRRLGTRRFKKFKGMLILFVDATSYPKIRSRGKKRRMPSIGQIPLHNLPTRNKVIAPGYQEICSSLLLKGKHGCVGISRRLHSEKAKWFRSQNQVEELEIRHAVDIVREAFGLEVIVVGDRGFRRKDLLHWFTRREKTAFIIRIQGNIRVTVRGKEGKLDVLAWKQRERIRRFWRDDKKSAIYSMIRAFQARLKLDSGEEFLIRVLHLAPLNAAISPMVLATSLPISSKEDLSEIVSLYSKRWTIETYFFRFKQTLGAHNFRVFSSWKAIDRLLIMAHMAFLALQLVFLISERSTRPLLRTIRREASLLLRSWTARPPDITLGRFIAVISLDFMRNVNQWHAIQ